MIDARARIREQPGFMKQWPDTVDSHLFHEAVMAAQFELLREMGTAQDAQTAAANAWRMEGVKKFLSILMTLADPDPKAPVRQPTNVNHRI